MHYGENLVCLTRSIQAPKVTGFSFFLIRKATGRIKPKKRSNIVISDSYMLVKDFQPY